MDDVRRAEEVGSADEAVRRADDVLDAGHVDPADPPSVLVELPDPPVAGEEEQYRLVGALTTVRSEGRDPPERANRPGRRDSAPPGPGTLGPGTLGPGTLVTVDLDSPDRPGELEGRIVRALSSGEVHVVIRGLPPREQRSSELRAHVESLARRAGRSIDLGHWFDPSRDFDPGRGSAAGPVTDRLASTP
ncbi:MAG: hypothetical protein ACK5O2_10230 [Microthrixaceae bacterium]